MRRRVVVFVTAIGAAVSMAGLAGCGAATTNSPCGIDQMRLALGPRYSEKTEQRTVGLVLTNLRSRPCSLDGYPTIALFDSLGRRLPFIYSHRGDQMITNAPPSRVYVRAGASAFFAFNKNVCVSGMNPPVARTLRVALPASPVSRSIQLPRYPFIDYCRGGDPGMSITISPIEARLADASCLSAKPCGPGGFRPVLGVPRATPAWLRERIRRTAQALGDAHPSKIVVTLNLRERGRLVHRVWMRGHFVCDTCTGPGTGRPAQKGRLAGFTVDARTRRSLSFSFHR